MLCAIWYHLYNFKNVKNTHGGKPAILLKLTFLHGCFSCFLNCANGTKSSKAFDHVIQSGVTCKIIC